MKNLTYSDGTRLKNQSKVRTYDQMSEVMAGRAATYHFQKGQIAPLYYNKLGQAVTGAEFHDEKNQYFEKSKKPSFWSTRFSMMIAKVPV